MPKLIALYKQPADPAAFDKAYFETHLPLIQKVPGLQRTHITRFTRSLIGDSYYLMAEMYFPDNDALKAGMKSPQMAAAGENLDSFAKGMYSLLFGEEAPN
ncbi:MAG: EthD family reductase [Anaerolineales bacterium]